MSATAVKTPLEAEYERARRARYAALTAHYGEIGSAAVIAALMCAPRKEANEQTSEAA